jgi:hypothetical protein
MLSSGMLCYVAPERINVLEERITSIIRVTRIGELGTMLAVTSNQSTLRYIPLKHWFLQDPHGVTSWKIALFFIFLISFFSVSIYVVCSMSIST